VAIERGRVKGMPVAGADDLDAALWGPG